MIKCGVQKHYDKLHDNLELMMDKFDWEYFWNLCLYLAGEYFFLLEEEKSDHSTADRMNSSSTWVDIF